MGVEPRARVARPFREGIAATTRPVRIGWCGAARKRVSICSALVVAIALFGGSAAGQVSSQRSSRATDPTSRPEVAAPQVPVPAPRLEDFETDMRARFASPDLLDAEIDPEVYVLGPNDVLAIMLMIGETRSHLLPVLPEGVVMVPGVGPVQASGKTLAEFRKGLQAAVSKRYRDYELYSYLARMRQFRVYVTGEVKQPGLLAARASERVSDLIDRAGGVTDRASRRQIEVLDPSGTVVARADLARFLVVGDLADNPHIGGGQVIHVPPRGRTVAINGEVRVPGNYETRQGETLRALLDLAGGPSAVADLSRVTVERIDPSGAVTVTSYDLQHETPDATNVTRVSVLSSLLGEQRVFFIGPDERQQTLYLSPGETLADLVRRTATLPPDADLAAARLATHDENGKPYQVAVDLNRVLAGEDDRPLHDGDVLSVSGIRDYVYVSGFVARPGRYVYRPEWTVNDYMGEAGGPTSGGSRNKTTLLGREGSKRSAARGSSVQRGETLYVDRSTGSKLVGALGVLINLSALAISLVALSR